MKLLSNPNSLRSRMFNRVSAGPWFYDVQSQNAASITNNSSQQGTQQNVLAAAQGPEARRQLATAVFAANSNVTIDIPRDTAIKRMELFMSAAFTVTYGSGSPVLSPLALLQRLIPNFTVIADGSRNIKVIDLYMQRCLNAIAYGGMPRRAYQTGASLTSTTRMPTTEWLAGTVAYPATTQDIVVNDCVNIDFENPYAYKAGKNVSLLYTRNLSTCNMNFTFGAIANVLNTGNGATVAYSNVDIQIIPTIIENREADITTGSFDFTETVIRKQFSSQTTFFSIDLNTGNKLLGLGIMAQNGDTALTLSDFVVTDLNLLQNGSTSIQKTNFKSLQEDNKQRYGVSDDQFASGVHALNGFAYMNLMKGGSVLGGLDTRLIVGVSQVQLQVSTAAATGVDAATYTNPVQCSIWQQQLIPVPTKN